MTDDDGATITDTLQVTVLHGFLRYCMYGNEGSGVKLDQDVRADCGETPSGVPGESRPSGVSARTAIDLNDRAVVIGNLTSLDDNVELGNDAQALGGIAAGGNVKIQDRALVQESIASGGKVEVRKQAEVQGDITAAGDITIDRNATVAGTVSPNTQPLAIPDITLVQFSATPGSLNVTVDKGTTLSLTSTTAYQDVKVEDGGTLIFTAGQYTMRKLNMKPRTFVHFDLTGGPIVIDIAENVDLSTDVQMQIVSDIGNADSILFRVGGDVKLDQNGLFLGTYLALNGDIELADNAVLIGALYGKNVNAKRGSQLVGLPARNLFASLFVDRDIDTSVASNRKTVHNVSVATDSESDSKIGVANNPASGDPSVEAVEQLEVESGAESDPKIFLPTVNR